MNSQTLTVWDAAEEVRRSASLPELAAATKRFADTAGFNHHGFAVRFPNTPGVAGQNYRYFHNIPEPWGTFRYERTYGTDAESRDPLIQHIKSGLPPTAFNCVGVATHSRSELIRRGTQKLGAAREFGITAGILAPLRAPGMDWGLLVMTTGDTDDVRDVLPTLPNAYFLAQFVLSAARDLIEQRPATLLPVLTPREREMLRWSAIGKTSWEIGIITSVSEKTVDFHLASAARKLNVRGRGAAVARAISLCLIAI